MNKCPLCTVVLQKRISLPIKNLGTEHHLYSYCLHTQPPHHPHSLVQIKPLQLILLPWPNNWGSPPHYLVGILFEVPLWRFNIVTAMISHHQELSLQAITHPCSRSIWSGTFAPTVSGTIPSNGRSFPPPSTSLPWSRYWGSPTKFLVKTLLEVHLLRFMFNMIFHQRTGSPKAIPHPGSRGSIGQGYLLL